MPPATLVHAETPRSEARREHHSLLAPWERRVLVWMAKRLPAWVSPDHLTLGSLASLLGAGGAYVLAATTPSALAIAVVALALNWLCDSLDGTLARVRQRLRPRYGFYVDHVVDAIGAGALLAGLGASGYMSPMVALTLLAAYFLLCIEVFLASQTVGTFQMSYFRIGPTELRILLAAGTIALYWNPTWTLLGHPVRLFDLGGSVGAMGLVVTMLRSAVQHTRLLYRQETIWRPSAGG